MGYIRMIRSAGFDHISNAIKFVPDLQVHLITIYIFFYISLLCCSDICIFTLSHSRILLLTQEIISFEELATKENLSAETLQATK